MAADDFFRARLDGMVDPRHPLAVLTGKMPWSEIEAALTPAFAHKDRKGRSVEGADMFGPTLLLAGAGVSPIRGRDAHCWAPPAQIPASAIHAPGSHLGCLSTNR